MHNSIYMSNVIESVSMYRLCIIILCKLFKVLGYQYVPACLHINTIISGWKKEMTEHETENLNEATGWSLHSMKVVNIYFSFVTQSRYRVRFRICYTILGHGSYNVSPCICCSIDSQFCVLCLTVQEPCFKDYEQWTDLGFGHSPEAFST